MDEDNENDSLKAEMLRTEKEKKRMDAEKERDILLRRMEEAKMRAVEGEEKKQAKREMLTDIWAEAMDGEPFYSEEEHSDGIDLPASEKLEYSWKIQKAQENQTEDIDHESEDSIVKELSQDDQSDIDIETVHLVEVESNISSFTNMRKPAASAAVHEDQSEQQSTKPKGNYTDTSIYHYYIFCKLQYKYIKVINNS